MSIDDLDRILYFSPEDILDYSSSIDLRKRAPFGIQQDVSLQGANFEDVTIRIEGVKVSDPQTGHFSMELPLTDVDISEVVVDRGKQEVSFSLCLPEEKGGFFRSAWGEHALWNNLVSCNFPLGNFKNRISFEHKVSSGGRQDTDFEIYTGSFFSVWERGISNMRMFLGVTKRNFGADSFYSDSFPSEEEHLMQTFSFLRWASYVFDKDYTLTFYFRRHHDKFILVRENPTFYTNYSSSYTYGMVGEVYLTPYVFLKMDMGEEKLNSTNMGKHKRFRRKFVLGGESTISNKLVLSGEAGMLYCNRWDNRKELNFNVGYIIGNNYQAYFSFNSFWRLPSFTELYYYSPANQGNLLLSAQQTKNFEWGFKWRKNYHLHSELAFFRREGKDVIDWVRSDSSHPWQAENIGEISTWGICTQVSWKEVDGIIPRMSLSYTYVTSAKEHSYSFSKYVFDYAKHKLVLTPFFNVKSWKISPVVTFLKPINRGGYTIAGIKLAREISCFTFYIEGMNIFNKDYEEIDGVDGVGRWYKTGIV